MACLRHAGGVLLVLVIVNDGAVCRCIDAFVTRALPGARKWGGAMQVEQHAGPDRGPAMRVRADAAVCGMAP